MRGQPGLAKRNRTVYLWGMFRFGSAQAKQRFGVIVDIGSGSVLAAIVASDPTADHPEIVWSKRAYSPLKKDASTKETAKNVMSSFMEVLTELDSKGRTALREQYPGSEIGSVQITVAAPWSYTITKTISYQKEDPFSITHDLIDDLLKRAQERTEEDLHENELAEKLGLAVAARMTINITANGYSLDTIEEQSARTVSLSHSSVITQHYLHDAIADAHQKMFKRAGLSTYSFMLVFYCAMRDLHPHLTEYCLIDVTYEATEIAIVRDGILRYCTHTPFGAYSIAREIHAIADLPLSEAYAHITGPDTEALRARCNEKQNKELDDMFNAYETRLRDLLAETGDDLSIPKRLIVHGTLRTEPFFKERLDRASRSLTKNPHIITTTTLPLITAHYPEDKLTEFKQKGADSALFVSAQFFHQCHHCDKVL